MKQYKVIHANILFDGAVYEVGDVIELTDADASRIQYYIEPSNQGNEPHAKEEPTEGTQEQAPIDYEEYTTEQLKKLVEERNIDVVATGKKGAIKSDYVNALLKADE